MCVFMASGGIVFFFFFFPSVSVYNGFGLRNTLRDGPLHNEKARGCFFSPHELMACNGKWQPSKPLRIPRPQSQSCGFQFFKTIPV